MAGVEKTVLIDGKSVTFYCSGATPMIYRRLFHRDLMLEMQGMKDIKKTGTMTASEMEMMDCMAFVMAKQATERNGGLFPWKSPEEWADEFGMFSLQGVYSTIFELWGKNNQTIATAKKKESEPNEN